MAFIAISSSLWVRTLAADIHFGLPVLPPPFCLLAGVALLRFGHMRVQACVSSHCRLQKGGLRTRFTIAIFGCLKFGSGSPRTVGLFYFVLLMDAQTQADNVAKLDVRLVQLLTEYRVSPEVMAMCGLAGLDTVSTLAHLADDKTLFRAAFTLTAGLDPNTGPKAV